VQSIEEGRRDQVNWPDHGWWCNEEPFTDPAEREPDKLSTHHEHPLISKRGNLFIEYTLGCDNIRLERELYQQT